MTRRPERIRLHPGGAETVLPQSDRCRWIRLVACFAALATVALAGCARSDGADDRLVRGWTALPEPRWQTPDVGQCLDGQAVRVFVYDDPPVHVVDCAEPHMLEVVYIGQFHRFRGE
jgi:hypothetical protein